MVKFNAITHFSAKDYLMKFLIKPALIAAISLGLAGIVQAENKLLKIGFVGVTSGPASVPGLNRGLMDMGNIA